MRVKIVFPLSKKDSSDLLNCYKIFRNGNQTRSRLKWDAALLIFLPVLMASWTSAVHPAGVLRHSQNGAKMTPFWVRSDRWVFASISSKCDGAVSSLRWVKRRKPFRCIWNAKISHFKRILSSLYSLCVSLSYGQLKLNKRLFIKNTLGDAPNFLKHLHYDEKTATKPTTAKKTTHITTTTFLPTIAHKMSQIFWLWSLD